MTQSQTDAFARATTSVSDDRLALIQETARVEKRVVETGRVRISSRAESIEEMVRASLVHEALSIERIPVGRTISGDDAVPHVTTEGDLTIVPVLEEILVVEKRLVLKEEIHIRRTTMREDVAMPVTLRKQRADVEHVEEPDNNDDQPKD